jgi:two-component system, cell cycle response regulator
MVSRRHAPSLRSASAQKESGIRPNRTTPPPASGVRVSSAPDIPKVWNDDDDSTDVSLTTNLIAAATRAASRPRLVVMHGDATGNILSLDGSDEHVIGRSHVADVRFDDASVSRVQCRIARCEDGYVIEDLGSRNGTIVNGIRLKSETRQLQAGDRIQVGENVVLQFTLLDPVEDTLARRLFDASTRDPLTKAYNRRHFSTRLESEIAYAKRHGAPLSVLLVDLDLFKGINDQHGHAAGDAVLVAVAAELGRAVRLEDVVARLGGEEFGLLVRSRLDDAATLAERIRARVEAARVRVGASSIGVTASIGVADLDDVAGDSTGEDLLAAADRRLYRAKSLGRNRVCADD